MNNILLFPLPAKCFSSPCLCCDWHSNAAPVRAVIQAGGSRDNAAKQKLFKVFTPWSVMQLIPFSPLLTASNASQERPLYLFFQSDFTLKQPARLLMPRKCRISFLECIKTSLNYSGASELFSQIPPPCGRVGNDYATSYRLDQPTTFQR